MEVLVIEDEPLIARNLIKQISAVAPDMTIAACLESVADAVHWLNTHPLPALIFSDIQLADGVCFEIFERVPVPTPVIFTTAYNEFAINAFQVNSIDYLLKPIELAALQRAIKKFKTRYASATTAPDWLPLLNYLRQNSHGSRTRFLVHSGDTLIPVSAQDVVSFTKETLIFLSTQKEKFITDYVSLDELEAQLPAHEFFRANRQTLIRLDAVTQISKHVTGKLEVLLQNGQRIDVSREKAQEFKSRVEGA